MLTSRQEKIKPWANGNGSEQLFTAVTRLVGMLCAIQLGTEVWELVTLTAGLCWAPFVGVDGACEDPVRIPHPARMRPA